MLGHCRAESEFFTWGKSCFEATLIQELLGVRGGKGQKEGNARVDVWQVDRMIHVSCLIQEEGVIVGESQAEKIADIYISISMGTFEHRKYKIRSEDGNK